MSSGPIDPAYARRHTAVYRAYGKAADYPCERGCGRQGRDWAQLHDTDGESPEDYEAMCRPCHIKYDGKGEAHSKAMAVISQGFIRDPMTGQFL